MALTQIRGSTQILNLSVTNSQIALPDASNPNGILLTKIQDGALLVKSNGSVPFTAPVGGVTPVGVNDLATKGYVDGVATGLDVKASVRAIAASSIVLSGAQSIDGVSLVAGDRVLVTAQATASQNGIYIVAAGAWARSPDADVSAEVTAGMFTFVEEGTANAGSGWVLTTSNPITLGTTNLTFAQFSAAGIIIGGAGLVKTGNTIDVVSANGGIVVGADAIALTLADSTLAITTSGLKLAPLPQGNVLVGNASGVATATAVSGDVSINAAGVTTIGTGAITNTKIATGTIGLDKLVVAGGAGQLLVTNVSGVPTYAALSGDATITSGGALTIGAAAVGTAKLVDASVTLTKIATLADAHFVVGTSAGNSSVAISGDVTITGTGVATVNAATVVTVASVVTRETPAGATDGTNPTFTLANTPKAGTEHVYLNGLLMDAGAGNDYTISGEVITFTFNPVSGDKIRVSYSK
jgi:hypothetical protein